MKQALKYHGYIGTIDVDVEDGCLHGTVQGIQDTVHYEGQTVEELEQAFRESVEDYLAMCREAGVEPDKSYSGRFVARVGEDLHRRAAALAAARGVSLNELVTRSLDRELASS